MPEGVSPDTHVFIGMFRPTIYPQHGRCEACTKNLGYGQGVNCWLAGHFDKPLYARREEILDRMANSNLPRLPSPPGWMIADPYSHMRAKP